MESNTGGTTALRGAALTYTGDAFAKGIEATMRHESDAIVAMAGGKITHFGPASEVLPKLPPGTTVRQTGKDTLILPGFIDCHVHYPQTQIIGAFGEQLIDWLNKYTFVAEQKFASKEHARSVAKVFLDECLRAGTTTAAVYCTVYPQSVDAFFEEADARNMRMINERSAPVLRALETAASVDPDAAELWERFQRQRRDGLNEIAVALRSKSERLRYDESTITDTLWMLTPDAYLRLVREAGWPVERFEAWLADVLIRVLLE